MAKLKGISIKKITAQRKARFANVAAVLAKSERPAVSESPKKIITEGYAEEVAQIVLHVAKRTAADLEEISDRSFQLIMSRFDRLEEQNTEQSRLLAEHKIVDDSVHKIVLRHENYWNVLKWGAGPTGIGAALAAWFGFHK